ncbi:hypothetical protein AAMO2058_000646800 [Amorphochlora amoebiformis]
MTEVKPVSSAVLPPLHTLVLHLPENTRRDDGVDRKDAGKLAEILQKNGHFSFVDVSEVLVGMVCRVRAGQRAPGDMLILSASSSEIYIQSPQFDGDMTVRMCQRLRLPGDVREILESLVKLSDEPKSERRQTPKLEIGIKLHGSNSEELKNTSAVDMDNNPIHQRHEIPAGSRLVLTDWVIGIIIFAQENTKYAIRGGEMGRSKAEKERKLREAAEKKKREEESRKREEEKKNKKSAIEKAREKEKAIKEIEKDGIYWSDCFSNVPDNGNCQVHCVWLGLKTLLQHYPDLALPDDYKVLGESSEHLREQLFRVLKTDNEYISEISEMFKTFSEKIGQDILVTLEDFFTLPPQIRTKILATSERIHLRDPIQQQRLPKLNTCPPEGKDDTCPSERKVDTCKPDYRKWAREYIEIASEPQVVNGRTIYLPLGASELRAISRYLQITVQVMTKEGVLEAGEGVILDEVDPRVVTKRSMQIFRGGENKRRVVRMLNLTENIHYMVHLPRAPMSSASGLDLRRDANFNDANFWGQRPRDEELDNLPPLD